MSRRTKTDLLPFAIAAAILLVAALDVATSAELVGSILFTFPIALCAVHGSKRLLWVATAAASVLTVCAHLFGIDRYEHADS